MKTIPTPLLTLMQSGIELGWADLFSILLPNNVTLYVTSGQADIVYGGHTYYNSQLGSWQRGQVTSEAGFSLKAGDMSLTAIFTPQNLFPNTTIPMMAAAASGLFDGALVTVYTTYWPGGQPPNASLGVETKFVGQITDFQQASRSKIDFSVGDYLYLLNLKTPPKVIQSSCRFVLYDLNEFALYGTRTGCTLNPASFSASNSVAAGSTSQTLNLSSTVAASIYAQGFVSFSSGQNSGLTLSIKSQPSTSQIILASPTPLPLSQGDTFTMYQGCDKTQPTCLNQFNNLINFGGTPYVPNPETAL